MSADFSSISTKPWYKTGKGIGFLFLGLIVVVVLLVFLGFFAYYAVTIKYGDATGLSEQFSTQKFSVNKNADVTAGLEKIDDINKYIHDFNPVLGNINSPVTVVAFVDFECPYSQEAFLGFNNLIKKYEPVIKVVFKHLPLTDLHPNALNASLAGACANTQNKFWPYYNNLFTNKDLTTEGLLKQAVSLGLNDIDFTNCFNNKITLDDVNIDLTDAVALGVRGTPTYFVNGVKLEGVIDEATWDKIILQVLNK
ncbi:MAG: DSBA oxidoreductase family protein [Candidatus Magasanikbacteria bacterium GW2011_GWC2_37_14]|uniref:DSBA oxidoreductase family protein n=1 Tax=Candidatus Magasanikbacteria bacterium GW2011_GWC2_37_14 TaxID=1619046 RepID=A0A0G0G9N6_9BACT|nr:MAG: DSBA oxidoreductase family protein [Candidatus Magasanikbacteria bacterium GW2011_GWC2_37_14]